MDMFIHHVCCAQPLSHVRLLVTPWTVTRQAPLPLEFSRQEYRSVLPFPAPGDFPTTRMEPGSPALQVVSLPTEPPGKPLYCYNYLKKQLFQLVRAEYSWNQQIRFLFLEKWFGHEQPRKFLWISAQLLCLCCCHLLESGEKMLHIQCKLFYLLETTQGICPIDSFSTASAFL